MRQVHAIDRRRFLHGTALGAGAAVLAACSSGNSTGTGGSKGGGKGSGKGGQDKGGGSKKGSPTTPLKPPSSFAEAPALKKQVDAGKLPKLTDRLPDKPYVVPHNWLETGKYGGRMQLICHKTDDTSNLEYMYGHSPLRWLNDGLDIGPGLAESWDSNDDASEWTIHFRKGLKWSDGHPWSTADILFWWEDLVLNDATDLTVPDPLRSGKGTVAKVTAPDQDTLKLTYDSPTPLTDSRLAMWTKGPHGNGPWWMVPKHYAKQWHPKYNKDAPKDWASAGGALETHVSLVKSPDCPTMNGWALKNYSEGKASVWERNPYYYCVDREGNQIPYVDGITFTAVQDFEVGKLQIKQGRYDYVDGRFVSVALADVSTFKHAAKSSHINIRLWDSGSGTGSMYFLNHDYKDPDVREVFRNTKFLRALSFAFDRKEVRKSIYFNTGFVTTGTMSPKAIEWKVNDQGHKAFVAWRDAYVKHDPAKAKKLLDEIGVVDKDGDGFRELPNGKKLTILLQHSSDAIQTHLHKNQLLIRDWKKVGIKAQDSPVASTSFGDQWGAGKLMTRSAWEVGDGPNCLVFPQWLVPIENSRWAPLEGEYYAVGSKKQGTEKDVDPFKRHPPRMEPTKGGPVEKLLELYDRSKTEPDEMKRHKIVWDMSKVHIEQGPFFSGSVSNFPQVMVVRDQLRNVPKREDLAQHGFVNPWTHPVPAVYDPETYYWEDPDKHT